MSVARTFRLEGGYDWATGVGKGARIRAFGGPSFLLFACPGTLLDNLAHRLAHRILRTRRSSDSLGNSTAGRAVYARVGQRPHVNT